MSEKEILNHYTYLLDQAAKAVALYHLTGHDLDWDLVVAKETEAADFAMKHEDILWPEGDTDGRLVL